MKKLLLLLALVGMVTMGCTDNPSSDDQNSSTEQPGPDVPVGDEDLSFTHNTDTTPEISHEGGTARISFTTSLSWSVSVYADWLSVSEDEGEAGNGSFVITAEANTTTRERKGVVAIKLSNNKSYEITVTQSFNTDSDDIEFINNTNTAPRMEYGGGTVQISFIAKTDWTVTCYADWLSTSESSGKKGENSFFITAASNPNDKERSGVVAIKTSNNKSYEIKVTQDPNAGIMQLTVAANEVLYTTIFDTQLNLYKENGFGGNLISHSYDTEKGYGSIRFDNYVTSIPSKAFKDCTTLESIYLPEGVTYIAPDAFEGCTNLKYIISPNSDNYTMFVYNNEIMVVAPAETHFVIPEGVQTVEQGVFANSKVESIVFPKSMKSIGNYSFQNNKTLKSIVFNGPTRIGKSAFYECSSLTSVTFALTTTSMGTSVIEEMGFKNCTALSSVIFFEDEFYSIGSQAFYGCTELKRLQLPQSGAFGNCVFAYSGLTELTIPGGISLHSECLSYCNKLKNVVIEAGVTEIPDCAFQYSSLQTITLPNTIETIGEKAFYGCSSLISLTIPESVTSLSYCALSGAKGELIIESKIIEANFSSTTIPVKTWLKDSRFSKLTIGDNITKIGEYAFKDYEIDTITIGSAVEYIGYNAFNERYTSAYFKPTVAPIPASGNFDLKIATMYVPRGYLDAYKNWTNRANEIVEYDF